MARGRRPGSRLLLEAPTSLLVGPTAWKPETWAGQEQQGGGRVGLALGYMVISNPVLGRCLPSGAGASLLSLKACIAAPVDIRWTASARLSSRGALLHASKGNTRLRSGPKGRLITTYFVGV